MNYYEYAKRHYTLEECECCKSFGTEQDDDSICENCEVKIIQELVKIIDEYKKCDGFLIAHGWWGGLPPVQYEVAYAADGSVQLTLMKEGKDQDEM